MKKFIKIIEENINKEKIYHFVGEIIIQLIVELTVSCIIKLINK